MCQVLVLSTFHVLIYLTATAILRGSAVIIYVVGKLRQDVVMYLAKVTQN